MVPFQINKKWKAYIKKANNYLATNGIIIHVTYGIYLSDIFHAYEKHEGPFLGQTLC